MYRFETKVLRLLGALALCLNVAACDNAIFTAKGTQAKNNTGQQLPNGDLLFINDSFEREDIYGDVANNLIYGWRGAITDNGSTTEAFTGDRVGMQIFDDSEMGPAFDGNRAVYFYGREGSDTHTLYLVSASFDLSQYNAVILSYQYLTAALNDLEDQNANFIEDIKLQVCNGPASLCGADDAAIDPAVIASSPNWYTLAASNPNDNDDSFDGRNHLASDFKNKQAIIDLNDESIVFDKSNFVFRFVVSLREGFPAGAVLPAGMIDGNRAIANIASSGVHENNRDCERSGDCKDKKKDCKDKDKCEKKSENCIKRDEYKILCEKRTDSFERECRKDDDEHEHHRYSVNSLFLDSERHGESGNGHDENENSKNAFGKCISACARVIGDSSEAKNKCKEECGSCRLYRHYEELCQKDRRDCDQPSPSPTRPPEITPTPSPTDVPPTPTPSPSPVPTVSPTATPTPVPVPRVLLDGVLLDLVQGVATTRDVSELF